MNTVTCLNCHATQHARHFFEPCSICGSTSRVHSAFSVPGLQIFPTVHIKVENPSYRGRHRHVRDTKSSAEHSVDGDLVRVNQLIDRGKNRYRKTVTVIDTGGVLRKADHALSKHTGHGSDKFRSKD